MWGKVARLNMLLQLMELKAGYSEDVFSCDDFLVLSLIVVTSRRSRPFLERRLRRLRRLMVNNAMVMARCDDSEVMSTWCYGRGYLDRLKYSCKTTRPLDVNSP